MLIFHPSDESASAATDGLPGPCLLVSVFPLSARHLNVLSESLMAGVNVSTLVVTLPSALVCVHTKNKKTPYVNNKQ